MYISFAFVSHSSSTNNTAKEKAQPDISQVVNQGLTKYQPSHTEALSKEPR